MRNLIIAAALGALFATPAHADDAAANAVYDRMQQAGTAADPADVLEKVYAAGSTYLPVTGKWASSNGLTF